MLVLRYLLYETRATGLVCYLTTFGGNREAYQALVHV